MLKLDKVFQLYVNIDPSTDSSTIFNDVKYLLKTSDDYCWWISYSGKNIRKKSKYQNVLTFYKLF